jgi:hypothetical protein
VRRLQYLRALAGARRFWRDQRGGIRFPPRAGGIPRPPPAIPRRATRPGGHDAPVDPRGKTQPDINRTQSGPAPDFEPAPPPRPRAPNEAAAREAEKEAHDKLRAAQKRSTEATEDFVHHRANKPNPGRGYPGDPANWSEEWDKELNRDMIERANARNKALEEWQAAQEEVEAFERAAQEAPAAERGRQRGGGFQAPVRQPAQPANPLPGCPPNCGNNNPTGPAGVVEIPGSSSGDQIAAGSSGVASSSVPGNTP